MYLNKGSFLNPAVLLLLCTNDNPTGYALYVRFYIYNFFYINNYIYEESMYAHLSDAMNSLMGIALYVAVLMLPRDKSSTTALVIVVSSSASTMLKK